MNIEEYLEASSRTESIPEEVRLTESRMGTLMDLVSAMRQTESLADQLKRNLFYGKKYAYLDQRKAPNDWLKEPLSERDTRLLHAALGMLTEVAELADTLLQTVLHKKELDVVNVMEELGDIEWYRAIPLRVLGLDEGQIRKANIYKLLARYPEKFSSEQALNRDLEAERAVLENGTNDTLGEDQ